jgi:chromatin remodeling complex protein RSC6
METTIAPEVSDVSSDKVSTSDSLKSILATLTTEATTIKNLILNVKSVLKDVERQSKDYDKLVNKRSRNKSEKKITDAPSGITKPVAISDELAVFLGVAPGTLVPRNEVTKGVSAYVRKYELSDPTNRQRFAFSDKPEGKSLFKLLGEPTEVVTYFNLQRYLKSHYIQVPAVDSVIAPAVSSSTKTKVVANTPVVPDPVVDATEKTKKKVMVKKVKKDSAQLSEE